MADRADESGGLRGSVRRAVGGALDATVGRVGDVVGEAALDVTGATAQQIIEELEPYLVDEAVPRIVAGLTPYLTKTVVPEVLAGVHEHLVEVTVPEVVRGITPQLVEELLPRVLEELRPYLEQELVPRVVAGIMPELEDRVAPQLIDALMPKIRDEVAPQLIEALMPRIEAEIAPRLVDALMPKISAEVAPELVDALMPKIRHEVVPTILDDIIEDPRVRDLIREQSQGLILDVLESIRENLADGDDLAEAAARRILRRTRRPAPESAVALVMEATGGGISAPRITIANLEEQRAIWRKSPMPPAPPGRGFAYAGVVTRVVSFAVDVSLVGWLLAQGLSSLVNLIDSVLDPIPPWLTVILSGIAVSLVPAYLAVAWSWLGRSIGSWVVGTRVCTPDGRKLGFWRALVRAVLGLFGVIIWVMAGPVSVFDKKRRSLLDLMLHTEVRYVVPDNQQHRYIREALQAERDKVRAEAARADREAELAAEAVVRHSVDHASAEDGVPEVVPDAVTEAPVVEGPAVEDPATGDVTDHPTQAAAVEEAAAMEAAAKDAPVEDLAGDAAEDVAEERAVPESGTEPG